MSCHSVYFSSRKKTFFALHFFRLRRLQASLLDGGKRADDKDLKEKRLKKKKAAEKRLKVKVQIF